MVLLYFELECQVLGPKNPPHTPHTIFDEKASLLYFGLFSTKSWTKSQTLGSIMASWFFST